MRSLKYIYELLIRGIPDAIIAVVEVLWFPLSRVSLSATSFVHHIDAPSLSLVCPLVQRALKDRSAEMKRKGAQIVGSMVLVWARLADSGPMGPGHLVFEAKGLWSPWAHWPIKAAPPQSNRRNITHAQ